jgi:hypothetical protein
MSALHIVRRSAFDHIFKELMLSQSTRTLTWIVL